MKTEGPTAIKAERNAFALPVCIWLFFWSVSIAKHDILIKTADAISQK